MKEEIREMLESLESELQSVATLQQRVDALESALICLLNALADDKPE